CEALRPALQTLTAEELKAAASPFAAELSQIFPELAGLAPLGQPPPPPEEQRVRLYDGVTALVQAAARQAPLVLLLDDIHWAPSLDLLAHVGRRLGAGGVLLLAAFREQEMSEHEALTRERMLLTRLPISAPLSLAPLSETDTAQMIAHHSSDRAAAALRGPVYRRSRGNPFVVEEALRLLVDSGSLRCATARRAGKSPPSPTSPFPPRSGCWSKTASGGWGQRRATCSTRPQSWGRSSISAYFRV
ncbi:MAG: hypothetical protein NTZ05_22630, partial [Chloroflexi bacterium]|nr:hypothetical protein [Chloroflexota bacterium]